MARKGSTFGMPVMVVLGVIILLIGGIAIPKKFVNMFTESSNVQWDQEQLNELGETASTKCASVSGGSRGESGTPAVITIDVRSGGNIDLAKQGQYDYQLRYNPPDGQSVNYDLTDCRYKMTFPGNNYESLTTGDWRITVKAFKTDTNHPIINMTVQVD